MAKKKASSVEVALKANGNVFKATGATVVDALANIKEFQPKTVGSLTVNNGKPINLNILALKRMFATGMTGEVNRTLIAKRAAFYA